MWQKFKDLPRGEQNKILIIFCLLILAAYFGVRYPILNKDTKYQESMVYRRIDRISKRIVQVDEPQVSTIRLNRQVKALDESIAQKKDRLNVLSRRFSSLDDIKQIQELKLELSQLADRTGLYVVNIGGEFQKGNSQLRRLSNQDSKKLIKEQSNNRYERPLTTMRASTNYVGLMNFLDGLSTLSYNLTVVRMEVSAVYDDKNRGVNLPNGMQPLEINFLLAL